MGIRLPNLLFDEVKETAEKALQSSLATLGVGMKKLVEDEKTFNEAVDIGYEVLPLPVRLFLRKEKFRLLIASIKERYITEQPLSEHLSDQLALPMSASSNSEIAGHSSGEDDETGKRSKQDE